MCNNRTESLDSYNDVEIPLVAATNLQNIKHAFGKIELRTLPFGKVLSIKDTTICSDMCQYIILEMISVRTIWTRKKMNLYNYTIVQIYEDTDCNFPECKAFEISNVKSSEVESICADSKLCSTKKLFSKTHLKQHNSLTPRHVVPNQKNHISENQKSHQRLSDKRIILAPYLVIITCSKGIIIPNLVLKSISL